MTHNLENAAIVHAGTLALIGEPESPLDYHACNAWCGDDHHVDVWHFHNFGSDRISFETTDEYLVNECLLKPRWLGPAETPCLRLDERQVRDCQRFLVELTSL